LKFLNEKKYKKIVSNTFGEQIMNLHEAQEIDAGLLLYFKQLANKICYPYNPPIGGIRVKDTG
jgi:hypothetical protein